MPHPDISKIEKQAKNILEKFAKALEKVEKEHEIESYIDREEFERKENPISDNNDNPEFKARILDNAPDKDEDFIIAEKGEWK